MADFNEIEDKAEEAFKALLDAHAPAALSGLTRFLGLSADSLTADRVEIVAEEAEEADETGNWNVALTVRVVTNSNTSPGAEANIRALHKKRSAALADLCLAPDFVSAMNTAYTSSTFHAMAWTDFRKARRVEDRDFISEFSGTLLCMGGNPT